MTRWPNFFIVGAPRAGTTSLYIYLKGHPDIYLPRVKEPHFFEEVDTDGEVDTTDVRQLKRFRQEGNYLELFQSAGTEQVVGEASVGYLRDKHAPERIHEKIPDAKIIMILRNPIERAYSDYVRMFQRGLERESFYEALKRDYARPRKVLGQARLYVESGLYYEAVKRYLDTFGSERVRVYLYEDLVSDTAGVVKDVCAFLQLPFYDGRFFNPDRIYNTSGKPRSAIIRILWPTRPIRGLEQWLLQIGTPPVMRLLIRRLLEKGNSEATIDPKANEFLLSLYRDDIVMLQSLIVRDLSHWLT